MNSIERVRECVDHLPTAYYREAARADLQRIQDALEAARAVNVELAVRGDGGVSMTLEDDLRAALARLDHAPAPQVAKEEGE